ncbi:MAG: 50S ribosomal protein L30 [Chloroflexi bacterium]|nr:50S ribosomal protein L30 [Chloroflexota bacterium]
MCGSSCRREGRPVAEHEAPAAARRLKIRLVKSPIGYAEQQKATVRSLGLRRLHQVVEQADTPQIRGMIAHVSHLVELVEDGETP